MIEKVAKASKIQAQLSASAAQWAAIHDHTRLPTNEGNMSPHAMWHGVKAHRRLFSGPTMLFQSKAERKIDAQAKLGFHLRPAWDHPRDPMRIYE